MSSSVSAKQQSDYFWLSFSVTWTCPSGLPLFFKSIEALGFKYLKGHRKSWSTEVLVCVSWTFKPDVRLVWSLTERGRERRTDGQRGREVDKSTWLWEGSKTLFIFSCSAAKRDSQHSPAPLTARPTTGSSFTERERESWRERNRWTDRGREGQSAETLQGSHLVHKQSERKSIKLLAKNNHFQKHNQQIQSLIWQGNKMILN